MLAAKPAVSTVPVDDPVARAFVAKAKAASVYSFRGGIQRLSDALVENLAAEHPGTVSLRANAPVAGLQFRDSSVLVTLKDGTSLEADQVISALPASALAPLVPAEETRALLSSIESADVAVVCLAYDGAVLPVDGFGYLVPQNEPSQLLGVVFDSCVLPGQGSPPQDESTGPTTNTTRLTAMIGGDVLRGLSAATGKDLESRLFAIASAEVRKVLGVAADPVAWRVAVHRACIPQYTLGHTGRLRRLHSELEAGAARGRLAVVGASYFGVGVNDCVFSAREVALAVAEGQRVTGLERAEQA
ncbi:hypothetical protein HK405_015310 [Cladochytrium tenue]|nr:hypothetical protein HK405_015310 [Cladochytrium tenue]